MKIETPFYVLAVDPGKMTGVSFVRCVSEEDAEMLWAGEVDEENFALCVRPPLKWFDENRETVRLVVTYERFLINMATAKNSQAPYSLEVIGNLKQCCRDVFYPVEQMVVQAPAEAKALVDNKKLKALDMWHKGGAGHANDATRHAVLTLLKLGYKDPLLLST